MKLTRREFLKMSLVAVAAFILKDISRLFKIGNRPSRLPGREAKHYSKLAG